MRRNGATLDHPTRGSRDRYLLIVTHEGPRVLEQRAFAREDERDDAAREARAKHGDEAVTCGFVRNYGGRSVTRVWL